MAAPSAGRVVVLFSGGADSLTLLYQARAQGQEPLAFSCDYGQAHAVELQYAERTCRLLGVERRVADLRDLAAQTMGGSALTPQPGAAPPLPREDYSPASMAVTVVPNRNMVMLAGALALAASQGVEEVWYGAHGGDAQVYPDCRPAFVQAMQTAASLCHQPGLRLHAPWLHMDKAAILRRGAELGVDYALSWSCYDAGPQPCRQCGACRARAAAFAAAGLDDPALQA